ncbi:MAG: protein phosphatase CheZ [Methylophilaceae bacterium]|nr:protein phosphatase CheZ [Methylophilaceae bacterium]
MSTESGDSEELEALFDSILREHHQDLVSAASHPPPAPAQPPKPAAAPEACVEEDFHTRIGHLTRQLHETLRELGYDKALEHAMGKIPDARDRLNYISSLTEQAATKTLNAVEQAKPLQQKLESGALQLASRWAELFEHKLDPEQFKVLVHQTRQYLQDVPLNTKATNAHLLDIVVAQDFQDLTGQVIKKLAETVQYLENQLIALLIASMPEEKRKEIDLSLLNGPVVNTAGRTDIVTSQAQVDELLESLGF